ncbi:MAG TPA: YggS family pyridoxal phosphate-dependent enzyme [Acidothermaceae bacterium]
MTSTNGVTPTTSGRDARRRELATNLQHLRQRIAAACAAAGRPVDDVAVIAITKTFPASDVVLLAELGVTDVGENRDQEAAPKVAEVAAVHERSSVLRWHFVGALQTNKCASVVRYASLIHSVDRLRVVDALAHAAQQTAVSCLVQVDLGETSSPGRAGARPEEVGVIADAVAAESRLELAGVMAVAPLGADPEAAFRKLAEIADAVRQRHPLARVISAGMSGDLEQAVANGATHLRVGSALLGARRHPVR